MATYEELKTRVEGALASGDEAAKAAVFLEVLEALKNTPEGEEHTKIELLLARETDNGPEEGDRTQQTPEPDMDEEEVVSP